VEIRGQVATGGFAWNPQNFAGFYYGIKDNAGAQSKLVTIAVHFKNAFRSAEQDLATVDGQWQISGTPIDVRINTDYGKMRIAPLILPRAS
jgi:hypothetical protein